MSVKVILNRLIELLNKKKVFPIFLFVYTILLSMAFIFYFNPLPWGLRKLTFIILFGIPYFVRFGLIEFLLKESEKDGYKFQAGLLKSTLKEFRLNEEKFRFEIIREDYPNIGIYLPISKFIVTTGFIKRLDDIKRDKEKYLKAILGHEVTHVKRFSKYSSEIIIIPIIILIVFHIINIFLVAKLITYGMLNLVQSKYYLVLMYFAAFLVIYLTYFYLSRQNEYKADEGSVKFGNQPKDLIDAFKIFWGTPLNEISFSEKLLEYFETHPLPYNRIKRLEKLKI